MGWTGTGTAGWVTAVLAFALAAGCSDDSADGGEAPMVPTSVATPKAMLAPHDFEGCEAYREYFADSLVRQVLHDGLPCWGCEPGIVMVDSAPLGVVFAGGIAATGETPGFQNVSQTNTQEAGVDEADLIEADSRGYFYIVRGRELLVADAAPAEEMNIVARLPLRTGAWSYPSGLYLDEPHHRVVVLAHWASPQYPAPEEEYAPPAGEGWIAIPFLPSAGTGLLFVDVTDPAQPVASQWRWTDSYLLDSRRVADRLHVVMRHQQGWPRALTESAQFRDRLATYYHARERGWQRETLAEQIEDDVRSAVAAAPLAEILPLQKAGFGDEPPEPIACTAVQHTGLEHRLGLMLIGSVNTDGTQPSVLATVNNAWQLYASHDYLYLAQYSGGWWFDERQTQQTAIYRFRLTDGPVVPAGFGLVDGWKRDAYSFGEHEGHLRLVTTENHFDERAGRWRVTNHLFVLGAGAGGELETTGAVRDFIRDERIFSSRFLGARGYVVTFRFVDPLFVFDLADPQAPRLAGQVEIPGFSTYVHPMDENHLLTIGRAGGFSSIQLQIFDVTDPAAPALTHSYVPPAPPQAWTYSPAEYDPHAFTYFAPEGLLSIPFHLWSYEPEQRFSGFLALRVDAASGFEELGRIDHGSARPDGCTPPGDAGTSWYYSWPLRSVVAQEADRTVLYTMSTALLKAGDVADLAQDLRSIPLRSADPFTLKDSAGSYAIGESFRLRYHDQAAITGEDLVVEFTRVNDSRCAEGAECFWAGEARVDVTAYKPGHEPVCYSLTTPGTGSASFLDYSITLNQLDPYPTAEHMPEPGEYEATLVVTKP
jgi:hypothetical protein